MTASGGASARVSPNDVGWKWLLLALCGLGLVVVFASVTDTFGLGGRPWRGWWDATVMTTDRPFVTVVAQPRPGGASATAGLRDGDRIDLREQRLDARYAWIYELMATRPTLLVVHRGARTFSTNVVGSSIWEGAPLWKLPGVVLAQLAAVCFLGCALLIALRRSSSYEARVVGLVLLFEVGTLVGPGFLVISDPKVSLVLFLVAKACALAASLLLVKLSSRFGVQYGWRRSLEWFAYATNGLDFLGSVVATVGLFTLWIDPLPYLSPWVLVHGSYPVLWSVFGDVALAAVAAVAVAAVASAPRSERPRAAWLLLPLPIALAAIGIVARLNALNPSWFLFSGILAVGNLLWLLGAVTVTYALLKRRVLDFEFVLGRTLVVAIVSLIVVAAFVLLEWLLGSVLAGVSHITGLVANAMLALVLGISLRYIHKRVDEFVDAALFRKRHDDERALAEFSKEAAYVTDPDVLLDHTIEKLQRHTDARDAALLVDAGGAYAAVRSFGDGVPVEVGENDGTVLALKTWHKPIDPHQYSTVLQGALALPMLARGRLVGILVLGERAGGEAYAPDEIEALSQLAHGVGAAFDALSTSKADPIEELTETIRDAVASLDDRMRALPDALAQRLRDSSLETR